MKRFLAFCLLGAVAVAAPTPLESVRGKRVVAIPPPSPTLRAQCESGGAWKHYGSVETCEDEKRLEELVAFQQARLAAEKMAAQSDEKILKDLGFDAKSAKNDVSMDTEATAETSEIVRD
jgi:hypothetical protein